MKKLFSTFLAILMATASLCADNQEPVKRVAILDVVDHEGNVDYATKLQLRSSLTSAITQIEGYESYDRVDMNAIFGEHDFQRTGAVSDEQIQRLGEMSGCDYVLITEAAVMDMRTILIVAKLVNVTTGRIERNADHQVSSTAESIRRGAQELAINLFDAQPIKQTGRQNNLRQTEREVRQSAREEIRRLDGSTFMLFGEGTEQSNNYSRRGFKIDTRISAMIADLGEDGSGAILSWTSLQLSAGTMAIRDRLYVGAGAGFTMIVPEYTEDMEGPEFFALARYYIFENKLTPYVELKAGGIVQWDAFIEPGFGFTYGKANLGISFTNFDEPIMLLNFGFTF